MDKKRSYKQIEKMIYEDADKAEKMLINADKEKHITNNEIVGLAIALGAQFRVKDELSKARNILNTTLNRSENADDKAEVYKYLALSFYDENNYDEAIKLYEQALLIAKDKYIIVSCYQGMGDVLYGLDKKEESLKYYLKSLNYFDKNRPELWSDIEYSMTSIIDLYLYSGNKAKAQAYIDRIIGNPQSSSRAFYSTYYDLAHYYYRRKEWEHALENYKLAFSHFDKKNHDVLADLYGYMGSCYHQLRKLGKAKINYQKSLEFTKEEEDRNEREKALKVINKGICKR